MPTRVSRKAARPLRNARSGTRKNLKLIQVAAGLVFRDGKLLITRRRSRDHLGGLWEFPGGKREKNESFEGCLERELMEELGILVEIKEEIDSITHRYPEKEVHLKFYRCKWLRNEPQAFECEAIEWVVMRELGKYAFPAADARILLRLKGRPEYWK